MVRTYFYEQTNITIWFSDECFLTFSLKMSWCINYVSYNEFLPSILSFSLSFFLLLHFPSPSSSFFFFVVLNPLFPFIYKILYNSTITLSSCKTSIQPEARPTYWTLDYTALQPTLFSSITPSLLVTIIIPYLWRKPAIPSEARRGPCNPVKTTCPPCPSSTSITPTDPSILVTLAGSITQEEASYPIRDQDSSVKASWSLLPYHSPGQLPENHVNQHPLPICTYLEWSQLSLISSSPYPSSDYWLKPPTASEDRAAFWNQEDPSQIRGHTYHQKSSP